MLLYRLHVLESGGIRGLCHGHVHITYYGNKDSVLLQQLYGLIVTTHTLSIICEKYQDLYSTWLVMIELGMCIDCRCYSVTYTLTAHSLVVFGN